MLCVWCGDVMCAKACLNTELWAWKCNGLRSVVVSEMTGV